MTYTRLGKKREALHGRSEQFKRGVIAYFQKRNYTLDKDSLIEGSFEDQIYFSKRGFQVSVECKDTEVSLNETAFLVPFGLNLVKYAQSSPENRFSYVFCCRDIKNKELAELVFGEVRDDAEARALFQRTIICLKNADREVTTRAAEVLEKIEIEDFFSFLNRVEILEGDYSDLERAAMEWEYSRKSSFLQSLESKERFIESFEKTTKPDPISETLASNLFKVISIPRDIYVANTRFRARKNLLNKVGYEADPFILKEKKLYTFSDLSDSENRLRDAINKESIQTKKIGEVFDTEEKQFWLTDLLNRCIVEYLYFRGLRRRGKRFVFISHEGEEVRLPWNPGTGRNRRRLTKCKMRDDGSIVYCIHKALIPSFKSIGNDYFLLLEPCFYFSKDGSEGLSPLKMTQFSSRAWAYHGNDRILYDLRFWMNFLCLGREILKIPTGGDSIRIDTLYETSLSQFGIEGDKLSNPELLSRIQHGVPPVFRDAPVKQTELSDYYDVDDGGVMDLEEMEGNDDEWN